MANSPWKFYSTSYKFVADYKEILLATFFLIFGTIFYFTSLDYPRSSRIFPQFLSAWVIIASVLILANSLFPNKIPKFIKPLLGVSRLAEPDMDKLEDKVESIRSENDKSESTEDNQPVNKTRIIHDSVAFVLFVTAYIIFGYMIGFLWATPLFVLSYLVYFKQSWTNILIITVFCFLAAYGFNDILYLGIDEGYLQEVILT